MSDQTEGLTVLRYGDKIRLWGRSHYAYSEDDRRGGFVGTYHKSGRWGHLTCIPPLGQPYQALYEPATFTLVHPENENDRSIFRYGSPVLLRDQSGLYLTNYLSRWVGYIGPQPYSASTRTLFGFLPANAATPDLPSPHLANKARWNEPITWDDGAVLLTVVDSVRGKKYSNVLRNYKKPNSKIIGGYLTCEKDCGREAVFELRRPEAHLGTITLVRHRDGLDARVMLSDDIPQGGQHFARSASMTGKQIGRFVPEPEDDVIRTLVIDDWSREYNIATTSELPLSTALCIDFPDLGSIRIPAYYLTPPPINRGPTKPLAQAGDPLPRPTLSPTSNLRSLSRPPTQGKISSASSLPPVSPTMAPLSPKPAISAPTHSPDGTELIDPAFYEKVFPLEGPFTGSSVRIRWARSAILPPAGDIPSLNPSIEQAAEAHDAQLTVASPSPSPSAATTVSPSSRNGKSKSGKRFSFSKFLSYLAAVLVIAAMVNAFISHMPLPYVSEYTPAARYAILAVLLSLIFMPIAHANDRFKKSISTSVLTSPASSSSPHSTSEMTSAEEMVHRGPLWTVMVYPPVDEAGRDLSTVRFGNLESIRTISKDRLAVAQIVQGIRMAAIRAEEEAKHAATAASAASSDSIHIDFTSSYTQTLAANASPGGASPPGSPGGANSYDAELVRLLTNTQPGRLYNARFSVEKPHPHVGGLVDFEDFEPQLFRKIRRAHGIDLQTYLNSWTFELSQIPGLALGAGRSGSLFLNSADGRFIFKTINNADMTTLRAVLRDYVEHVCTKPSRLMKFVALHRVVFRETNSAHYLVVGLNMFYLPPGITIEHKYDLKGRRPKKPAEKRLQYANSGVWKDNQINRVFMTHPRTYDMLMDSIKEDVAFLQSHDMMDYSLLVGVANTRGVNTKALFPQNYFDKLASPGEAPVISSDPAFGEVYTIGIIDFLSQYQTWKKQTAHFFKSFLWSDEELSTVNSKYYAERFLTYMKTIFPPPGSLIIQESDPRESAHLIEQARRENRPYVVLPSGVKAAPPMPTAIRP